MQPTYNINKAKLALNILLFLLSIVSCKKLIDIDAPATSVNEANVYASDATAISVLTGIYTNMSGPNSDFTGSSGISLFAGLSADEFTLFTGFTDERYVAYYTNGLLSNPSQTFGSEYWSSLYNYIFTCNAAIEGLTSSNTLTTATKQQLLGEAKFMRAFYYFYLVNLFGDVPLVISTDPDVNSRLSRTPNMILSKLIVEDLKEAVSLVVTGATPLDQFVAEFQSELTFPRQVASSASAGS